jgi:hypothetical protein
LGSRNRTFVNGHAVERAALHELDIVTLRIRTPGFMSGTFAAPP